LDSNHLEGHRTDFEFLAYALDLALNLIEELQLILKVLIRGILAQKLIQLLLNLFAPQPAEFVEALKEVIDDVLGALY